MPPSSKSGAKSKKGKKKKKEKLHISYLDDLDEGVNYRPDDVLPSGSLTYPSKRHTRKHLAPLVDPLKFKL